VKPPEGDKHDSGLALIVMLDYASPLFCGNLLLFHLVVV